MTNLSRAMVVLEMLVGEPGGVRVTDIALKMAVNRAIPYRILSELCNLGYVAQDSETERYRATLKVGSLGLRQLETAGVMGWSRDGLRKLATTSQELVRVSIASGETLRFVAQAQGASSALIVSSPLSAELALHATASGKAYLSTLPHDEVAAIVLRRGLPDLTQRTVTSSNSLEHELDQVREAGFSVVEEEAEPGISAVAAAIVPPESTTGRAVGAVSIAGPTVRLSRERLLALAPEVCATATRLAEDWHVLDYLRALSEPDQDD